MVGGGWCCCFALWHHGSLPSAAHPLSPSPLLPAILSPAFLDHEDPTDNYKNSITCVQDPFNDMCFNDG